MLKIKNYRFNISVEEIIEQLKQETSRRGKNLFKDIVMRDRYVTVTCPYHKDGQETKPSAGFNLETGFFNCFTCSEKHSLEEVIAFCLDCSTTAAIEWLKENFAYNISEATKLDFTSKKKPKVEYVTDMAQYRMFHPYMFQRKLSKEVIKRYEVGYDKKTDCIVFPNKDEQGNILFLARRSVKSKFFNYPKDVEKPIYGLYELQRDLPNTKSVIICESMINCLTCRTWDYPAFALNGTGTAEQLEKLCKLPYLTYILALDGDDAGKKGTEKLIKKLENKKIIYVIDIPKGKDVNDLEKDEFDALYANKLSLLEYRRRNKVKKTIL